MATVASTVIDFMNHHPRAIIMAEGETPAKTRLYQMGINANWNDISQLFEIEGFIEGHWETFNQMKNYEAFILRAR